MERAKGFEPSAQPSEPIQPQLVQNFTPAGCTQIRVQIHDPGTPDLERVIAVWPSLAKGLKAAILAIVNSVGTDQEDQP